MLYLLTLSARPQTNCDRIQRDKHARSGLAAQGYLRPRLCPADRECHAHRQGLNRRASGSSEFACA